MFTFHNWQVVSFNYGVARFKRAVFILFSFFFSFAHHAYITDDSKIKSNGEKTYNNLNVLLNILFSLHDKFSQI